MHDLQKVAAECISELKAIDIPIQDEKIKEIVAVPLDEDGCDGHCLIINEDKYRIEIYEKMLDNHVRLVSLKRLICHELLHTCEGCMNHKGTFRRYSRKIDKIYNYGMMTGDDDYLHPENPILDKFQCTKCKYIYYYKKKENSDEARAVKALSEDFLSRCPFCGGKMFHTKLQE